METLAIVLGLILMMITAVCTFLMANWQAFEAWRDARAGRTQSEQIQAIFSELWDGKEITRASAWRRTILHLQLGDYPTEMVVEAELRLLLLDYGQPSGRRSHYSVTSGGRVIHITQIKGLPKLYNRHY